MCSMCQFDLTARLNCHTYVYLCIILHVCEIETTLLYVFSAVGLAYSISHSVCVYVVIPCCV